MHVLHHFMRRFVRLRVGVRAYVLVVMKMFHRRDARSENHMHMLQSSADRMCENDARVRLLRRSQ